MLPEWRLSFTAVVDVMLNFGVCHFHLGPQVAPSVSQVLLPALQDPLSALLIVAVTLSNCPHLTLTLRPGGGRNSRPSGPLLALA